MDNSATISRNTVDIYTEQGYPADIAHFLGQVEARLGYEIPGLIALDHALNQLTVRAVFPLPIEVQELIAQKWHSLIAPWERFPRFEFNNLNGLTKKEAYHPRMLAEIRAEKRAKRTTHDGPF